MNPGAPPKTPPETLLVFFDGVCGLCNHFVDFLVRQDRHRRLRYAPLQGTTATHVLRGLVPAQTVAGLETIVFYDAGRVFLQSNAVIEALYQLGGYWRLIKIFKVIPVALRDQLYRWVAQNRYRWFGRHDVCRLPSPAERELFFD